MTTLSSPAVRAAAPIFAATPTWTRECAMSPRLGTRNERWRRVSGDGDTIEVDVAATIAKPLDVMRLRGLDPEGARTDIADIAARANALKARGLHAVAACPCCTQPRQTAAVALTVAGLDYLRCSGCGHLYVGQQAGGDALAEQFSDSDDLAALYTDAAAIEVRMQQVVRPKRDWVLDVAAAHGITVSSCIDVGAGGGHFVAAATETIPHARGYEISRASCAFARSQFGIEMIEGDFLEATPTDGRADLVTLWGVLEYVPDPRPFLAHAATMLADDGLLIVEVPRADAFSTAIQTAFPDTVWRHLEPTSHVNVFSDASLATILWDAGFQPVAAWYFGMDAFELIGQLGLRLGDGVDALGPALLGLQAAFDAALLCDDIVVAAVRRP